MTSNVSLVSVSTESAASWVQGSLEQGNGISAELLQTDLLVGGVYVALMPKAPADKTHRFAEGGVASRESVDQQVTSLLEDWAPRWKATVVVENDVMRRGDPALARFPYPAAYLGDRVVHWQDLSQQRGELATALLRRASTGYPTNGFLVKDTASALGLEADALLDAGWPRRIVRALAAVFIGAFDGESFILWLPADGTVDAR